MARVAEDLLRQQFPEVPLNIEVVKEPDHKAVGNGTGIMYVSRPHTVVPNPVTSFLLTK